MNIVTNLTGTTWKFNSTVNLNGGSYTINFTSNNQQFIRLRATSTYLVYDTANNVIIVTDNVWFNEDYRVINILGGDDATNKEFIQWLENNAVQQIVPDEGNMTNGEQWTKTITLSRKEGTLFTINSNKNYVDKSIALTINAKSDSPTFTGGGLYNKSATASFTNVTTGNTNTSGAYFRAIGSAASGAVYYGDAVDGWVSKYSGDVASHGSSVTSWEGGLYYITGVTIENGKQFDVVIPQGSGETATFHFNVSQSGDITLSYDCPWMDNNRNVMTDNANNSIRFVGEKDSQSLSGAGTLSF